MPVTAPALIRRDGHRFLCGTGDQRGAGGIPLPLVGIPPQRAERSTETLIASVCGGSARPLARNPGHDEGADRASAVSVALADDSSDVGFHVTSS